MDIEGPLKWTLVVGTKMVKTQRQDHTDNVLTLSQAFKVLVHIFFSGKLGEGFVVD